MRARRVGRRWSIQVNVNVVPEDVQRQPFMQEGDAVSSDFFAMFDVPFRFGSGWSVADDDHRAAVVVISSALNQKFFGGGNSVGRQIHLYRHEYRVVGVLDDWNPQPRFFDVSSVLFPFGHPRQFYLPFSRAIDLHKATSGDFTCSADTSNPDLPNWDAVLHSECAWIGAWVELPTRAAAGQYLRYLRNYAAEQQRIGRFGWPPNVRLSNVRQWLYLNHVVPQASKLSLIVSCSFLLTCLVNVAGLMQARFMRRAPEIGVRRVLGATRGDILGYFQTENFLIVSGGVVLGSVLGVLANVALMRQYELARMPWWLLAVGAVLLWLLGQLAVLGPARRAAAVSPVEATRSA